MNTRRTTFALLVSCAFVLGCSPQKPTPFGRFVEGTTGSEEKDPEELSSSTGAPSSGMSSQTTVGDGSGTEGASTEPNPEGSSSSGGASVCGDGSISEGEQCDGADLNGQSCRGLGYSSGSLACSNCQFDTLACTTAVCGDGILDESEACDGDLLGGATCAQQGFLTGPLYCDKDCQSFITVACSMFSGSCCDEDGNATPGCEDGLCTALICEVDPYCCENPWGPLCAEQALHEPWCECITPIGQ